MSENKNITQAAWIVGTAAFLSRISGFIRDMFIAGFFGAGLSADAFFAAFRISNLFRKLFADGAMTITFIPIFTQYLTNKGKNEAFKFALSAIKLISALLVIIVILGIFFSPLIVHIIAPGFVEIYQKFSLTVTLTRVMFPYIFFICLLSICMGILNGLGHFGAPAFAPLIFNIAMIGSIFLISPWLQNPVLGLGIGVLIGGALQLAVQIPFLRNKGLNIKQKTDFFHPGVKKAGIQMIPAILGASVFQINVFIGTVLASLLAEGSVSYLYYADRLVQFPLGIIAVSTATAALPSLSRQVLKNDLKNLQHTLISTLKLVLFITIPAMIGLIALREPIVSILFERGAFNAETTKLTGAAILYYGIGIWAFAGVRILLAGFYAFQDTRTPGLIAGLSVIFNFVLSIILMKYMGYCGIALSTSLASILNFFLLCVGLRIKLGAIQWKSIAGSVFKTLFSSLIMGGVILLFSEFVLSGYGLSGLFVNIALGVIVFFFMSYLMMSNELKMVLNQLKNRHLS